MYYREADFAIIVFDLMDTQSYQRAKQWVDEVRKNSVTNPIICICGNKCDRPRENWKVDMNFVEQFC